MGIPIGSITQIFADYIAPGRMLASGTLALLAVAGVGYGFELFSKISGKGHHELMDAIATILGGVIGIAVTMAILMKLFY
ncbi:MAG: hypothetical protein ACTHLD_19590 [Chitinophaga sp.]